MSKPWFIDVLTFVLAGVWMAWTFATIQQHGPSFQLLASAVVVLVAALLLVYHQRLSYLQIGNYIVIGMSGGTGEEGEPAEWQKEN